MGRQCRSGRGCRSDNFWQIEFRQCSFCSIEFSVADRPRHFGAIGFRQSRFWTVGCSVADRSRNFCEIDFGGDRSRPRQFLRYLNSPAAVEQASVLLRPQATPLLVMERDAVAGALVTDASHPGGIDPGQEARRLRQEENGNDTRGRDTQEGLGALACSFGSPVTTAI